MLEEIRICENGGNSDGAVDPPQETEGEFPKRNSNKRNAEMKMHEITRKPKMTRINVNHEFLNALGWHPWECI